MSVTVVHHSSLEGLFRRVRSAILGVTHAQFGIQFHLRRLARLAGIAPRSIELETPRLFEVGVLKDSRENNHRYFLANTENTTSRLVTEIIRTNHRESLVSVLKETFGQVPGIERAFIFGSEAKGTAKSESDLDVILISTCSFTDVMNASMHASLVLGGREVNALRYTQVEWHDLLAMGNEFAVQVEAGPRIEFIGCDYERG